MNQVMKAKWDIFENGRWVAYDKETGRYFMSRNYDDLMKKIQESH